MSSPFIIIFSSVVRKVRQIRSHFLNKQLRLSIFVKKLSHTMAKTNVSAKAYAENYLDLLEQYGGQVSQDVQQEIEDLCYFVPEVAHHFKILNKIGEGTFSSVFLARLRHHPEITDMFALKHIIPTSHPNRILGELRCLQLIGGSENVMGVELCLRNKDHIVIVMRYFPHHRFQDYLLKFDINDVRDYMRNLLIALRHVHKFDVIHRDIKPSNFLHNTVTKQYSLVDFGLAHDAPVKLISANKDRSPVVKEHTRGRLQADRIQKENVHTLQGKLSTCDKLDHRLESSSRHEDKMNKVEGDLPNLKVQNVQSLSMQTRVISPCKRKILSPSKDSAVSPNKKVVLSSRKDTSNLTKNILFPPPPPPFSGLSRSKKTPHPGKETQYPASTSQERQFCLSTSSEKASVFASSLKYVYHSPRRRLLAQQIVTAQEKMQKKKIEDVTAPISSTKRSGHRPGTLASCQCYGRPIICSICSARTAQSAHRAGTPGFRAPEVLMKNPKQSTAVDIWSAGVIFLSLLSGRYPFFRASDDLTCLCQIISVLGTQELQQAAQKYGKLLTCRPVTQPLELKQMCLSLRSRPNTSGKAAPNTPKLWTDIPDSAIDLLKKLLDPFPDTRITATQALVHDFFQE